MIRDIHAASVTIDSCGLLKLSDFGIARFLRQLRTQAQARQGCYLVRGSFVITTGEISISVIMLRIQPPEREQRPDLLTQTGDVWAVGALTVLMTTGFHHNHTEPAHASSKAINQSPTKNTSSPLPLGLLPATTSKSLRAFVRACLLPNPRKRATVDQLLAMSFFQINPVDATNEMLRTVCTDLDESMQRLMASSASSSSLPRKSHDIGNTRGLPSRQSGSRHSTAKQMPMSTPTQPRISRAVNSSNAKK